MIGPENAFSRHLHSVKYRQPEECFDDYCVRYARTVADGDKHFRHLLGGLREQRILPGGRQQLAVGNPYQTTAFSCFVGANIPDSLSGIMDELKDSMMTLRTGGGCGWNFSTLRPAGDPVRGLGPGASSSGPVSFMGMWDAGCSTIQSAGMRRGAIIGVLDVSHPDILKFVRAKRKQGALTNFNISVGITDDFMAAVEADGLYDLTFGGTVYNRVRAVDVWAVIMESTWDWAEPGVLFLDRINRMNTLSYCETIRSSNPCVTGDTEILTASGYRSISECVGQTLDVWNGRQWSRVKPCVTGENQEIVAVELSNGVTIKCTPYHSFIMDGGDRVRADALKPGDALAKFPMPLIPGGENDVGKNDQAYRQGFFSGDGCWKLGKPEVWLYGEKKRLLPHFLTTSVNEYSASSGDTRLQVSLSGEYAAKDFVPSAMESATFRMCWFAGLCDSDGVAVRTKKDSGEWSSTTIQVSSVDRSFLLRVRKMLNTLGVDAWVTRMSKAGNKLLPDGRGGSAYYHCKDCWRLLVAAPGVWRLQSTGLFRPQRLKLGVSAPQRDAGRFTRVVTVTPAGVAAKVYCFTDDDNHSGTFEGVVLGQCSEQCLPPHGACLLGSLNLVKYVVPTYSRRVRLDQSTHRRCGYELDLDLLKADIRASVRAYDNVIEVTTYPLPQQEVEAKAKRRMGVGYTGVANALEICGTPYGTPEYIEAQNVVMAVLRDTAYNMSCDLAVEKGCFPLFDAEKWLASGYAQTLPEPIRDRIRRDGLRNGVLLSHAPCGTISLCADNVSSSIEPVYQHEITRLVQTADGPVEVHLDDYAYDRFGVRGRLAEEVSPEEHVAVLCAAQHYVDASISKTINCAGARGRDPLPGEITFEQFKDVYKMAYVGGAKGCATFNSNGLRMGILKPREKKPVPEGGILEVSTIDSVDQATVETLYDVPEADVSIPGSNGACHYEPGRGSTCGD